MKKGKREEGRGKRTMRLTQSKIQNPKSKIRNRSVRSRSARRSPPIASGIWTRRPPRLFTPARLNPILSARWRGRTYAREAASCHAANGANRAGGRVPNRFGLRRFTRYILQRTENARLQCPQSRRGNVQRRIVLLAPSGWQISGPRTRGSGSTWRRIMGRIAPILRFRVPEGLAKIDIANAITLNSFPKTGRLSRRNLC